MEEQTFLNEGGVTVTNARFIVPGQTYAMSNITSVKFLKKSPSRVGPVLFIIIGLIFLAFLWPVGLVLIIIGILLLILMKPAYFVMLASSSGEVEALVHKDKEYINRVVNALNESIVNRG